MQSAPRPRDSATCQGSMRKSLRRQGSEQAARAALEAALRAGHARLKAGGSSVDAVAATITVLEDAPQFNARGNAAKFNGHLHLYQIADDVWGTPEAVSALQPHYPNAKTNVMETLEPADFGSKKIGHLDFFRSAHRDTLWPHAVERLKAFG